MDADVQPSRPEGLQSLDQTLLKVALALDSVLGVAFLGTFLVLLYLRRWRKYDLEEPSKWAIIGCLGSMSLFEIFRCSANGLRMEHPEPSHALKTYYTAAGIVSTFALHLTNCLLFYIIYQITHLLLRGSWSGEYFIPGDSPVIGPWNLSVEDLMDGITQIICWAASLEILVLNVFMTIKTTGPRRTLREPIILSLVTITLFFGLNMMKAVTDIIWDFRLDHTSITTRCAMVVVRSVFFICIYAAIIPLSLKWGLRRHYEHDRQPEDWSNYLSPTRKPEEKQVPESADADTLTEWGFSWLADVEMDSSKSILTPNLPPTPNSSTFHPVIEWLNAINLKLPLKDENSHRQLLGHEEAWVIKLTTKHSYFEQIEADC
ncbi:hypothetical protein N7468_006263 [Penicillium chermesinum]|uniref:Uncharacterized protein n=1 Tax=Penicillium chermesinum TaxID=63820 RepID=A0A9W9NU62_9EURO|nr:uncharacterized protein N7468_006263 [Penicillium chermesinum]KAJ5225038.1 hypothetical protein N7468_006263 [Penicillium chermesinum]KAJ6151767.1 hypothetical protein N7470_006895 [Penicillium chermesinum]